MVIFLIIKENWEPPHDHAPKEGHENWRANTSSVCLGYGRMPFLAAFKFPYTSVCLSREGLVTSEALRYNGGRAHYIIESKVQWKPFWLATQQYPQNDWLGGKFPYTMTYAHGPHCTEQRRPGVLVKRFKAFNENVSKHSMTFKHAGSDRDLICAGTRGLSMVVNNIEIQVSLGLSAFGKESARLHFFLFFTSLQRLKSQKKVIVMATDYHIFFSKLPVKEKVSFAK